MSTSLPQSGGTTASFGNAPQANGDSFSYIEDYLMTNGLLYNQTTRTLTLDVMANDLGGKAKSLFSIDDGLGNQLSDLATSDLLANQSYSAWQQTANGNSIRIVNGKIEYRLSDGNNGVRDVNSLNAGEVLTDTFTYAIKLGNGTLSWARVTISLTGNNDGATITGTSTGNVVEAGGDDNALPGTPSAAGTLTVSDVDSGQATFAAPLLASLAGTYGNFTFSPSTGQWTYTLDNARPATQSLAQGEEHTETLTVTSLDGTATQAITVTVKGTNDGPEITSGAQAGTVQEDTALSASGQVTASDVDNGAVLTYTGNATGSYGSLAVTAASGEWTYTLDNAAHQALAQGEEHVETFTVTVTDEFGASTTQDVTVTVKGTNDGPEITSGAQAGTVQEDTALSASGQVTAEDVDNGAVLEYTGNASGSYGSFVVDAASGEWTYSLDNDAHQNLAQGEEHVETFTVTVTDEFGAATTQDVTIKVKGTYDGPEITSGVQAGSVQEDATLTASGQVEASDVDNGAVLEYTGNASGTYGSFAVTSATGAWTYILDNAAHQNLAAGEEHTETFTVTVTDEYGFTSFQDVEVTITGSNDAPVLTGEMAATVTEGGTYVVTSTDMGLVDPDDNAADALYTVSAVTGGEVRVGGVVQSTFTGAQLAAGQVTYVHGGGESPNASFDVTVEDGNEDGSMPTPTTFFITVTPVNDAAVITGVVSGTIVEDALPPTIGGDANSTDVDGVNDAWIAASGTSAYGSWSVNAAGQWSYTLNNGNAAVNALNNGQTLPDSFTIQTADGTSATVAITINGTTDMVALILPNTYTGTGDPNDFDNLGAAGNAVVGNSTNGNDTIYGGAGNDSINGGAGNDTIYAGSGDDTANGNNDQDNLFGGSGNDTLTGANGNDLLVGGYGADTLTGSNGADIFRFLSLLDTNDRIVDFGAGGADKLDFAGIDANAATAGNQTFAWGGTTATANGLWYQYDATNNVTKLYADTDGNLGTAEFMVTLDGNIDLNAAQLAGNIVL